MRGIECAFWGVLGADPELRTSKGGKPFCTLSIAVTVGTNADDGRDVTQWIRTACFGQVAEDIAARAKKLDRVYCEGQLTLNTWADKTTGETKSGLNLAAWKVEKVANIGKARQFRGKDNAEPSYKTAAAKQLAESHFRPAEPCQRQRPYIQGLNDDRDLNDPLPW